MSVLILASSCSSIELTKGYPLVLAHGAKTGELSYNSLESINEALKSPYVDGVEVDVVLTKDFVPILAHDPWISQENCKRVDAKPFDKTLIREILFNDLIKQYQCSYLPSGNKKEHYTHMISLKEFLQIVKKQPDFHVYLDIKIQHNLTHDAVSYAKALRRELADSKLTNPLYMELPTVEAVILFDDYVGSQHYQSVISYPAFYTGENWTIIGGVKAFKTLFFPGSPKQLALKAKAEVVMSPTLIMSKAAVKELHNNAVKYGTFLVDDQKSFNKACAYGADIIISDYFSSIRC